MKPTEKIALISLSIGAGSSATFYYFWPHAHWAAYPGIALIVAAVFYGQIVKSTADERQADGPSRAKSVRAKVRGGHAPDVHLADLMPHVEDLAGGKPSDNQRRALARLGMGDVPEAINSQQASAILSARTYAETITTTAVADRDTAQEVTPALIAFIVADRALRDRVLAWNDRSFARNTGGGYAPKKDEHWKRVAAEAKRLSGIL